MVKSPKVSPFPPRILATPDPVRQGDTLDVGYDFDGLPPAVDTVTLTVQIVMQGPIGASLKGEITVARGSTSPVPIPAGARSCQIADQTGDTPVKSVGIT